MSYLEVLMQNPPPVNSAFKVSVEEEKVIVPDKEEEKVVHQKKDFKKQTKTFKNKNPFRKSEQEKREFDPNYKDAFKLAQNACLTFCTPNDKESDIISQSIMHIHNWEGYYKKVDLEDDLIKIELLDKEYEFSKKRFLSNSYFQKEVKEHYDEKFQNTYLKFFETKDGNYKIHVKAGN